MATCKADICIRDDTYRCTKDVGHDGGGTEQHLSREHIEWDDDEEGALTHTDNEEAYD